MAQATRRGLSWNLASAIGTNALRLVIVAVLGRLLDSHDFGLVAAAISVIVLFYAIRDVGIGRALVQRKEVDHRHLATSFAVSTYLGVGISLLLISCAPLIGMVYRIEESVDILRVLSLVFAIRGVAITSRMMCQRAMQFRRIALIDQASFVVGASVNIVSALAGGGAWSLVIGYLVEETFATVLYVVKSPPPFVLKIHRESLRDLMQFGLAETVSQIVATLATYGDNYVVGSMLGPRMLGFYTRAYDLVKFPATVFDKIAGSVLFPMFSRFQDDRARLALGLRRAMFINALVLLPASATLFVLAPEAVRILLGGKWESSILPFRVLVLTMLMRTSWKVGAWIAGAAGLIRGVAIVNTLYMFAVIIGAALSVRWGIVGVAATTAAAIALAFVGTTYLALKTSGLHWPELGRAHVPGLLIALLVGGAAWPLAELLRDRALPTSITFITVALAAIALSGACTVVLVVRSRGDFAWLRAEASRLRRRRGS